VITSIYQLETRIVETYMTESRESMIRVLRMGCNDDVNDHDVNDAVNDAAND